MDVSIPVSEKLEVLSDLFIQSLIVDRNFDQFMINISDKVVWVGLNENEISLNKEELNNLYKNWDIPSKSYCVVDNFHKSIELSEDYGISLSDIHVVSDDVEVPLRFSINWINENSAWKIIHVHISSSILYDFKTDSIVEKEAVNERLEQASATDSVTMINNMEGFCKNVERLLKHNEGIRYALVKFGIKDFRYVNQRYGYSAGDRVLKNIGKNLKLSCKETETCGRIEKDTFAMLYEFKNKRSISRRMDNVRKTMIDKSLIYELGTDFELNAGIYIIPKSTNEHVKKMLDKALMAQQQIDHHMKGDHYLFYDESMMEKQFFINQILSNAPSALENEEFQLYIQPQFDIATRNVIAGEALCRWETRKGKLISPNDFIPLFEDYGLILEFDFYMLKKLCQKMKEWMDSGRIITPISINQSRLHIENEDYIENFCKIVDEYQIPHHYIAFELTESAFVKQYEKMIELAASLHKKGFQLAIDDFGTGFASLNLLSVLSADILKVDKSLVDNINTKRGKAVLEKVIELAHQMEMTVVCEGIEKMEQLIQLKELGCDIGQGYLISKPIPASEFEKIWIKRAKPRENN